MSLNTTPRTWVAGEKPPATTMNTEVRDAITGIQSAWTAYTPVVTGYTSVTHTVSGAYQRIGKTIWFRLQVKLATVSTLGTAVINISLPVAAAASLPTYNRVGVAVWRNSTGSNLLGVAGVAASATVLTCDFADADNTTNFLLGFTGAKPPAQTVGDAVMVTGTYEAA